MAELLKILTEEVPQNWEISTEDMDDEVDNIIFAYPDVRHPSKNGGLTLTTPELKRLRGRRIMIDYYRDNGDIYICDQIFNTDADFDPSRGIWSDLSSWDDLNGVELSLADPKSFEKIRNAVKKYAKEIENSK